MNVRIRNIKLSPDAGREDVLQRALAILRKKDNQIENFRIVRQSVDARKKQVQLVYSVELTLKEGGNVPQHPDVCVLEPEEVPRPLNSRLTDRPIVVGTGPCGLFCALTLARAGATPIILERGARVDERTRRVDQYWQGGALDINTNVQFGEGGAGTFSDGKLTTRIGDKRAKQVLEDFHRFGADEDILYKAKPHIGTDVLRQVIKNIRQHLIALGCEFQFETALTDLHIKNGILQGITTSKEEYIPCQHLILAIGHSARETYEMLLKKGVSIVQKPFSVGVRIEHLQKDINKAMYGDFAGHPALGAADYQLSYRQGEDACYSFCMCPGGIVVAAASEPETIVTNGMSYRSRSEQNANSALCVNVDKRDFDSDHPLAGVYYQRDLERKAFSITGGKGAPLQTVGGFLTGKIAAPGKVVPSYTGQTVLTDLQNVLPKRVTKMLQQGLLVFDKKIEGFAHPEALITGPETRTSAPVRIVRDEQTQSVSTKGLYPAGEGAGYAGGIMSAAGDGIRVAQAILTQEEDTEL